MFANSLHIVYVHYSVDAELKTDSFGLSFMVVIALLVNFLQIYYFCPVISPVSLIPEAR